MKDKISILGRHASIMERVYARVNKELKRPLHPSQARVARDYFVRGMRVIMCQCGRNFGKTEAILYIATVAALLNDKFLIYIITPERKQGKEIYWASKRLQSYAPPEFVEDEKDTDIRLTFKNGSFICVDGCENYNAHRGLKPNLVIYDEFQGHSKEFHLEVMAPNLIGKASSLLIFGTPPKSRASFYVEFRDNLLKQIKEEDPTRSYYELKTEENPSIDKKELAKIRKELFDSGNEIIWYREYEGKLVFGGEDVVFPKWNPKVHCRTHKVIMSYLENDKHKLKWFTVCDPGTSSCFAVLFACYNPFTQQIFLLDEIYEKDRRRTDSRSIWDRIRNKEKELYPESDERTWRRFYDEQAIWFANEIAANFGIGLLPTRKQRVHEDEGISRAKIVMAHANSLLVSDRCYWFRWEVESYVTDEYGRYVDKNNHFLDCLSGGTLVETLDGAIPIADLVGKAGLLYSREGKICRFSDVRKTHTNVAMVRVEFSDGRFIECTPGHKFLLASGEWQAASCLHQGVLIQSATDGSNSCQQSGTNLRWESVPPISKRKILQSWLRKASQASLGVPLWPYSQRVSCPPFRWLLHQQLSLQSFFSFPKGPYQFAYVGEQASFAARTYDPERSPNRQSLAWFGGRESLAFSERKKPLAEYGACSKNVFPVWQKIFSKKNREIPIQILPPKLQSKTFAPTAQVSKVLPIAPSDTYCMGVDDTNCLAVNGGIIVHNCFRYLLDATGWKLVEKVDSDALPDNSFLKKQQSTLTDPNDWADKAVESSLWVDPNDLYRDYFDF